MVGKPRRDLSDLIDIAGAIPVGVDFLQGYLLGRPNLDRPKYDPATVARYFPRDPGAE